MTIGPAQEPLQVSLGFGAKSGLAAWIEKQGTLRTRPVDASGAPTGASQAVEIAGDERPHSVVPAGADFIVTVVKTVREADGVKRARRAVLVRPDGRVAGSWSSVGSPDLFVKWGRTESRGAAFARVGHRGRENDANQPAVWVEVRVDKDGTVMEEARLVVPAVTTDGGEPAVRIRGEGPASILLSRSKTLVVQGRSLALRDASLAKVVHHDHPISGRWLPGGEKGLLGAPDRRLRLVWFEADKVHAADVRDNGMTTNQKTYAPLSPIPDFPDEIELWGGGVGSRQGYAPSFSRERVFLPQSKYENGVSSPDPRFLLPEVEIDGGKKLPIEDGTVEWSGTSIVYAYREGTELRVRAGACSGR